MLPVLLLLAGRDRIIDNQPTRDLVAKFAGPKEIVEYPESPHHTLEFEPNPERHITDLLNWLGETDAQRLTRKPRTPRT